MVRSGRNIYIGGVMASIYDMGDIWNMVREYKNKRRLSGGQPVASDLEAIYKGGLSSMYDNMDKKKSLALQEKNSDRNYNLSLQQLALNKKAQENAGKQSMMSGLTSLPQALLAGYGIGKQLGWWGKDKQPQGQPGIDYMPRNANEDWQNYVNDWGGYPQYDFYDGINMLGDPVYDPYGAVPEYDFGEGFLEDFFKEWFM
jgi:hypothetical protein